MQKKPKFNPVITRIKLNPEQAVLACSCYTARRVWRRTGTRSAGTTVCGARGRLGVTRSFPNYSTTGTSAVSS